MKESPENVPQRKSFTESKLREMAETNPIFAKTISDAFYTWQNHFADKHGKQFSLEEFSKLLVDRHRFTMLSAQDFHEIENTLAHSGLLGRSAQESYPEASEKDIHSVEYHQSADEITPIVIGEIGGKRIMLDGDHRAIGATSRGKKVPAFIVNLDD